MNRSWTRGLEEKMAGEIVISPFPNRTIKKWREIFHISQTELARSMGKGPSYISDYESGRRPSPGTRTIKMFIEAFIRIDKGRGYPVARKLCPEDKHSAIIDIMELSSPWKVDDFFPHIDVELLVRPTVVHNIMGYTVIDSLKAILNFTSSDYHQVYGGSSERCLIFTDVNIGRSPMVAIRAHPMTPSAVIYHKPEKVDELAKKIAALENVYLGTTHMELKEMLERLRKIDMIQLK